MSTEPQSTGSLAHSMELLSRVVALVVVVSVGMGVAFNIGFFAATGGPWIFFLSASDNLTASLIALPVVATMLAAVAASVSFEVRTGLAPVFFVVVAVVLGALFYGLGSFGIIDADKRWGGIAISGIVIATLLPSMSIVRLLKTKALPERWEQFRIPSVCLVVVVVAVTLGIGAGVSAGSAAHLRPQTVELELTNKQLVKASLVRVLDSGFVLLQDGIPTWIPRSEIKRLSVIHPPEERVR